MSTTRITLRELRADDLHRALLKARGRIDRIEHIPRVAFAWPRAVLDVAVADLVADGRLAENAHGNLIVRRHFTPEVAPDGDRGGCPSVRSPGLTGENW